jgi:hypothetical protein
VLGLADGDAEIETDGLAEILADGVTEGLAEIEADGEALALLLATYSLAPTSHTASATSSSGLSFPAMSYLKSGSPAVSLRRKSSKSVVAVTSL